MTVMVKTRGLLNRADAMTGAIGPRMVWDSGTGQYAPSAKNTALTVRTKM